MNNNVEVLYLYLLGVFVFFIGFASRTIYRWLEDKVKDDYLSFDLLIGFVFSLHWIGLTLYFVIDVFIRTTVWLTFPTIKKVLLSIKKKYKENR